jgi:hypothetical protein
VTRDRKRHNNKYASVERRDVIGFFYFIAENVRNEKDLRRIADRELGSRVSFEAAKEENTRRELLQLPW